MEHGLTNENALIVPIWKNELSPLEAQRVLISVRNFSSGTPFFVGPRGVDYSWYEKRFPSFKVERFDDYFFENRSSYSDWLLLPVLYDRFKNHEYLTICQTDAIIVRDFKSSNWDFDYLGSPWVPQKKVGWNPISKRVQTETLRLFRRTIVVGNGGLSIRRVEAFRRFTRKLAGFARGFTNEDVTISFFADKFGLRLAPAQLAAKMFMESEAARWTPGAEIPDVFGFHGLGVFNPRLEQRILLTMLDTRQGR